MGAYIHCDIFLSCSAFSAGLVPISHTASDIASNPERDKRPTLEKIVLLEYIAIFLCIDTSREILSQHTLSVYSLIFHHVIRLSYIRTRTHTEECLTSYIRIFVMFCNVSFICTCWYINLILFLLLCFECSFLRVVYIVCFSIMSHYKLWEPVVKWLSS